jgi:hypothetical protein
MKPNKESLAELADMLFHPWGPSFKSQQERNIFNYSLVGFRIAIFEGH